jgi:hypothetical protein
MNIGEILNKKGDKIYFYMIWDADRDNAQLPVSLFMQSPVVRNRKTSTKRRLKSWKQRNVS